MAEDLVHWAPRLAMALKAVGPRIQARLRAVTAKLKIDAQRSAPRRSGRLARSIYATLSKKGIELGSTAPYARITEMGGVIYPRNARALAIPLQRGLPEMGPRHDGKLFVLRTRSGGVYLARDRGNTLDVRWKLVSSVRRRAQPFLRPALERLRRRLPTEVGDEAAAALRARVRGG